MAESPKEQEGEAEAWAFSADRPIPGRKEDRFQRAGFADALVTQVLALPKSDSFVLGLIGPWGSGKTSILSMVEEAVATKDDVVVLKFNPWLFSGTEQLAAHFFQELAAQLHELSDKKLQQAGDLLVGYSEALSPLSALPFIGKWAERLAGGAKFLGGIFRRKGGALPASVTSQRREIAKLLAVHGKRLLVVIDDIDRLPKADIRELFKLVRLTADFPNTTYLLAFDRPRVEDALGETEGEGRAYLEKILQVTFDVPVIRQPDLAVFLLKEIERAVGDREHGPFDAAEWTNIFALAIRPLFRTPRDVRRFTNGIPVALSVIGDEIAVADVLAIEAIRCMLPDVWAQIQVCADVLTNTSDRTFASVRRSDVEKGKFEALLAAAGDYRPAVQEFCVRVFPPSRRYIDNHHYGPESSQRWRKERRLANADVLKFYFEKSLPSDVLRSSAVEAVFDKLGDENALRATLSGYDDATIEHVCARLEVYQEEFPPEVAEPALVVFFEQYPRLREGRRGEYDFGAGMAIARLGLRLLRRVEKEQERDEIVQRVASKIQNLSARKELLELVGWHKDAGSKLVSQATSAELEAGLQSAILAATSSALALERDLIWLLRWADDGEDAVPALSKAAAADESFLLRLLRSGLSERSSRGLNDVAGRQQLTLPWGYLIELLGAELLAQRVDELAARRGALTLDERDDRALETALRYRAGWRPGRFMEDEYVNGSGPSVEDLAEQRKFGAPILLELLSSVIPARRKVACDRISHMIDNDVKVADTVVARIAELIEDSGNSSSDRIALLGLLRRLKQEVRVLGALSAQWFISQMVPELSALVGACYQDHPERLSEIVRALERVVVETAEVDRVRDGVLAVGNLFKDHAAELNDDEVTHAQAMVERFASIDELAPALELVRKAHAGEH